ncbi:hypothetical protein ZHAS_00008605 [Anopheles sinensis]|uniref:Uncharacterized protein n=1 Tax=Anopheles sinensis TaxID=74873 RepID=A0A084VSP9_ANOSI|nr:hypothetical protein ZHAS_00008605 [Anopheles sinensis]
MEAKTERAGNATSASSFVHVVQRCLEFGTNFFLLFVRFKRFAKGPTTQNRHPASDSSASGKDGAIACDGTVFEVEFFRNIPIDWLAIGGGVEKGLICSQVLQLGAQWFAYRSRAVMVWQLKRDEALATRSKGSKRWR